MNWRGIKRRLKRNPALLDMKYQVLPGMAEAMARSMRTFAETAEAVQRCASLPEDRRNTLARVLSAKPRPHPRRAFAALACALAAVLFLAASVSGVFLPREDARLAAQLTLYQQDDAEASSARQPAHAAGAVVRCGWPWQDTTILYEYVLREGKPQIQSVLCVSVRGERSRLFPFAITDFTWSDEDGALLFTLRGRRDYRLFEREYVWTAAYDAAEQGLFAAQGRQGEDVRPLEGGDF